MNKIHAFNTGSWYTEHGQRIGIVETQDGMLVLCDIDRNIDGYVPAGFYRHDSPKERVRKAYLQSGWEYWMFPTELGYLVLDDLKQQARTAALTAPSLQGQGARA